MKTQVSNLYRVQVKKIKKIIFLNYLMLILISYEINWKLLHIIFYSN